MDGLEHDAVIHGGLDLQAVADDAGVVHQRLLLLLVIGDHLVDAKAVEGRPETLPFVQNTFPGKSCLKTFQNQQLVKLLVVIQRAAPFLIVVFDIDLIFQIAPTASFEMFHPVCSPLALLYMSGF